MSKPRGLYTPVYQSLPTHRKTVRAAEALKCDRIKLVGHLVALWTWSLGNVPREGGPFSPTELAFAAGWSRKDAARFASTLDDVGFVDYRDDGYYLHEWDQYGGKVAETAAKDRERKGGGSTEIPRNRGGIPTLDREREVDGDQDPLSVPPTPHRTGLTPKQEQVRVYLHGEARDKLLGGSNAPDIDWCEDLIRRGLRVSDVDVAIQASLPAKGLAYCRAVMMRRVEERENGVDHDQLARDRAAAAARESHAGASRSRGVARNGAGGGSFDEFGVAPPHAIGAADHGGDAAEGAGARARGRIAGRIGPSGIVG